MTIRFHNKATRLVLRKYIRVRITFVSVVIGILQQHVGVFSAS